MDKQRGSVLLATTVIIMMLISIVVLSMLFLSVNEFQSVYHYVHYEKAYYLALAAKEELLATLSENWHTSTDRLDCKVSNGEYGYEIMREEDNRKEVKVYGKSEFTKREFNCTVEVPPSTISLGDLKEYALYCQGQLIIEELGDIDCGEVSPGFIGVTGDLSIIRCSGVRSHAIDVKGRTKVEDGSSRFLLNNSFVDTHLPSCRLADKAEYFDWLQVNFQEEIVTVDGDGGEIRVNNDTLPGEGVSQKIMVFRNADTLVMENGSYKGLILFDGVGQITISDTAEIHGTMLVFGDQTEEIHVGGRVYGNVLLCDVKGETFFDGKLDYDIEEVEGLIPYLSPPQLDNKAGGKVNVIQWKEVI